MPSLPERRAMAEELVAELKNTLSSDTLCIACVLVTGITSQNALLTGRTPSQVFGTFCNSSHNPVGKDAAPGIS